MKIDYYHEIETTIYSNARQQGCLRGIVVGISVENEIVVGYAVLFPEVEIVYFLKAEEITPTGICYSRDVFY